MCIRHYAAPSVVLQLRDSYAGLLRAAALKTTALALGEATPDAKALIMSQGIFEALGTDIA
jgi:hypothetical protein